VGVPLGGGVGLGGVEGAFGILRVSMNEFSRCLFLNEPPRMPVRWPRLAVTIQNEGP